MTKKKTPVAVEAAPFNQVANAFDTAIGPIVQRAQHLILVGLELLNRPLGKVSASAMKPMQGRLYLAPKLRFRGVYGLKDFAGPSHGLQILNLAFLAFRPSVSDQTQFDTLAEVKHFRPGFYFCPACKKQYPFSAKEEKEYRKRTGETFTCKCTGGNEPGVQLRWSFEVPGINDTNPIVESMYEMWSSLEAPKPALVSDILPEPFVVVTDEYKPADYTPVSAPAKLLTEKLAAPDKRMHIVPFDLWRKAMPPTPYEGIRWTVPRNSKDEAFVMGWLTFDQVFREDSRFGISYSLAKARLQESQEDTEV